MSAADRDDGWLAGRQVWVITSGANATSAIVAGLLDAGAKVTQLGDDAETLAAAPAGVAKVTGGFGSQAAADEAIQRLAQASGSPDLVVVSILPHAALRIAPITEFTETEWRDASSEGVRGLVYLLRALRPRIEGRGVAVALVGPSLSLVGCPEMVALSTLLEGLRGLMKSVARQWGGIGVTLNWIAAAPRALSPLFEAAPLAVKPDMVSVALGRPADPRAEIAPVLGFLGSPAGRGMTGATLTLDGGEWMVP